MRSQHRIGVILAAGRGRRMGGAKQLAEWKTAAGVKPLVAAAYDAIRPICHDMIVVLGHDERHVVAALEGRPFLHARADPDAPMFESIRCGLRQALVIHPNGTVVLHPGDHPEVAPSTLTALADASLQWPDQAIIPQFHATGGHPVLISPNVARLLAETDCPTGLGDYWLAHPELCHRVPVADAGVLRDIDTPGDLHR